MFADVMVNIDDIKFKHHSTVRVLYVYRHKQVIVHTFKLPPPPHTKERSINKMCEYETATAISKAEKFTWIWVRWLETDLKNVGGQLSLYKF